MSTAAWNKTEMSRGTLPEEAAGHGASDYASKGSPVGRKALFFDIDGTLLSEVTRQVPESTIKALALARAQGHLVFVNTGRTYGELGKIRHLVEPDGWLCGCGTYIEAEGEVLVHQVMSREQIRQIAQKAVQCDVDGLLEGMEGCVVLTEDTRYPTGRRLRNNPEFPVRYLREGEPTGDIEKFCVVADDQSWKEEFFASLGPQIQVIDRGNDFYECVPAGYSKASAIDRILEKYGLGLEDAYVFGDSTNDLPMFEHVPNAVLMGRHDKELEAYASFVTRTVEEDGILYAMEQLGLIPGGNFCIAQTDADSHDMVFSEAPAQSDHDQGGGNASPTEHAVSAPAESGDPRSMPEDSKEAPEYFPLFFNMEDRKVLVAGAGAVGTRRAEILADFGARVLVTAPEGSDRMAEMAVTGKVTWERRPFLPQDLEGCFLAIAATDDTRTNDRIVSLCQEQHIFVNHAGDRTRCDVYFPGIARKDHIVAGITASGKDHTLARQITEKVQDVLSEL